VCYGLWSLLEKCNEETETGKGLLWSMVSSECNEEIVTCKWCVIARVVFADTCILKYAKTKKAQI
jgi:hypothetical protein